MKTVLALVLSLFVACPAWAGCEKPVYHLVLAQPAPCEGYLFSVEKELEQRKRNEEYQLLKEKSKIDSKRVELYKLQAEALEQIIAKESEKAELWRTRAEDITSKYVSTNEYRGTRDFLFMGAGIALTVLAAWSIGQVK